MPMDGPLHSAADAGDVERLKELLEVRKEIPIDAPGANDRTALHRAVGSGSVAAVKYLLSQGANILAQDRQKRTPFHWAALVGNVDLLRLFLEFAEEKGIALDPNALVGEEGNTALHFAASNKHYDAINFLAAHKKVNRETKNAAGKTAWEFFLDSHPNVEPPGALNPSWSLDSQKTFTPEATVHATLLKLLNHPKGKVLFYNYLKKNYAEENYLLYDELLKLTRIASLDQKLDKAQSIYARFLSLDSSQSTHVPEEIIERFNKSRESDEVEALDEAIQNLKNSIFQQLLEVFLSGFSISSEYRAFLQDPNSVEEPLLPIEGDAAKEPTRPLTPGANPKSGGLLFGGANVSKYTNVLGIGAPTVSKGIKDVDVDAIIAESRAAAEAIEKSNQAKPPPPDSESDSDSDAYLLSDSDEESGDDQKEGEGCKQQ